MKTRTSAKTPSTAAPMANTLSTMLTPANEGIGRGAGGRAGAAGAATAGRPAEAAATGAGAEVGAPATGAAGAGVAAATAEGDGILIVGAAVGLGGKLMRTVSFFGCTLADSEGFGGRAPEGTLGVFSAIYLDLLAQTMFHATRCQMLITADKGTPLSTPSTQPLLRMKLSNARVCRPRGRPHHDRP